MNGKLRLKSSCEEAERAERADDLLPATEIHGRICSMLVVDGSFEEQIDEIATFIDSLSEGESKVQETVEHLLQEEDKEGSIRAVVNSSAALNNASEKDFESSHNLFIHLLLASEDVAAYLPTVLTNFSNVPAFTNGPNLSYTILTTLFNVSPTEHRYPIFRTIIELCKEHKLYEPLLPKLKNLPSWLKEWRSSPVEARAIYTQSADLCEAAGVEQRPTEYLIRAVETFTTDDDSLKLTIRTVNATLKEVERLTFDDLLVLPAIRALQTHSPSHHELLCLLSTGSYADYKSFLSSYPTFVSDNFIDADVLETKFRLLTLVTLAAKQDSRKLRYESIATALEVPASEVEAWVINSLKTGLVEGKLSQPSETFLIHRATFRTFDHEQWEEVSAKLASWKESLQGILEVVDNVKNNLAGAPQLTNGHNGSQRDDDEIRSQAPSDVDSVDQYAD